ncbi:myb-like protein X isoform X2 [Melanotaenia boesemani]|uniref:myb-like protein X isoform X2 n=1 Tax=Melanotaenia boesemani TaxID=1250792 RepID=UPI001C0408DB|nr:myb-like protein X isoform X2 [Melanotaenia boesemani]
MNFRYIFGYCIFTSCLVAGESPIYGLQGQAVELKTNIKSTPDEILWKRNGNKVLEFNGIEETLYGSFKNRVTLDWHSADLTIEGLTFEDSGDYELEVFTKKILDRTSYKLQVIDKVAKPNVTCEMHKDGGSDESGKHATLTCSVESRQFQSLMTFEWSSNGNVQRGQNLTISVGDGHDSEEHTCTVSNPLTRASTVFTAKECNPVKENSTTLIVIICVICALLLLAALLFILHRKGCFSTAGKTDVEKQPCRDEGVSREGQPLINRAPTLPSHQKLAHLHHRNTEDEDGHSELGEHSPKGNVRGRVSDIEQRTTQQHAAKTKDKDGGISPTHVLNSPCSAPVQDLSVNDQEPANEDKHKDATEKDDSESYSSESEKADDALAGKDKDSKTSSPPPVGPKPRPVPADKDELKEAAEEDGSEGASSDSEKKNDALPEPVKIRVIKLEKNNQQHTPAAGQNKDSKISSPPPVAPKSSSVSHPSVNDQETADKNELKEAAKKDDSEKKNDALSGQNKDSKISSPPPVAPKSSSVSHPSVKHQETADKDELKEAAKKDDSEKKNDALSGQDKDSKISSPPPVAPKSSSVSPPSVNDQETADKNELKEAAEKDDSEKKDDALPELVKSRVFKFEENNQQHTPAAGQDKDSKISSPPPVAPKAFSVKRPSVNDQETADKNELKEAAEKDDSEKKNDALSELVKSRVFKFEENNQQHTPAAGQDKDSKISSPPPVAPKAFSVKRPSVNDQETADKNELKEAAEKDDSEKKNDALSEPVKSRVFKFEENNQQHTPAAAPKSSSVSHPSVNDQETADKDELKEAAEKDDSEKKNDALSESDEEMDEDATFASQSDVSASADQPHPASTPNTPNMAPKDDADKT